jgi:DNA-binding LytR/AlgR family response regulator
MRCLIVDDDEMARKSLEMMCDKIEDLTVVGMCENGLEALNFLNKEEVDLILLDIEMPELNGMELVRMKPDIPQVIFTTTLKEYALEAFEYKVTDYLHKPIVLSRLLKAIDKAREVHGKKTSKEISELYVKVDGRHVRLSLDDILYIESIGDYVVFHTEKKEKFIVHSTLKNIDAKIDNSKFLKVHRSYIVNLSKIVDIEETNLVIKDKVIPISRAHKPVLMNHLKTL